MLRFSDAGWKDMSRCPGCGRQDSLGTQFCTTCGTLLRAAGADDAEAPAPLLLRPPGRTVAGPVAPPQQTVGGWPFPAEPQRVEGELPPVDHTEPLAAVHRSRSPLIVGLAAAGSLGLIVLIAVGIVLARNDGSRSVSVEPVATSRTTTPVPTESDYPSTSSSTDFPYTPEPTPTYSSSSDYSDSSGYSTSSSTPSYGPYDGDYASPSPSPTPEPSYSSAPTSGETLTVHEGGGDLNVRLSPSTSATSIAIVPDGGSFTYSCYTTGEYVVGSVTTSDTWLYVSTAGGDGYISAAFAEVEPDHEFGPHC